MESRFFEYPTEMEIGSKNSRGLKVKGKCLLTFLLMEQKIAWNNLQLEKSDFTVLYANYTMQWFETFLSFLTGKENLYSSSGDW